MRAVHVRVRHDNDTVIAQLVGGVFVFADAGAEHTNQRGYFGGRQQLVETRLLHVQNLAAQRQNRLELTVAALLGRTTGGIALDQIQLTQGRVAFLAICQFAG